MIRKSAYFEQTCRFLDSELSDEELSQFKAQLEIDSELADELSLHSEMQKALSEADVISLRSKLDRIVQNQPDSDNITNADFFSFELSDELSSFQNLDASVYDEDILNFEHSFPKIHLYQHKIAGKENIHQFYKEQGKTEAANQSEVLSADDEALLSDIRDAVKESDIAELRVSLKQIARSIPAHNYSAEQIEEYLTNGMEPGMLAQFKEEILINKSLARDVRLSREIDQAGAEFDIMDLRATLQEIQKSEMHAAYPMEQMEAYIHHELSDQEMASFETELTSNQDLIAEINLIKDIDKALAENDVMSLRSKLSRIAADAASQKQSERSFAARLTTRKMLIASVAASLILLLGIAGLISRNTSQKEIYQRFYATYQTNSIARDANLSANQAFASAMQKFDSKDYHAAQTLFQKVIASEPNNMVGHFYAGVAFQETGKYSEAIGEYQAVIRQRDNLFVQQAQWYLALCLLKTDEEEKAYAQFTQIAQKEGYYQNKAKAVLRKLKYLN
jgi:hypothetical protein